MQRIEKVEQLLSTRNIPYKLSGDQQEVSMDCLFCDDKKKHLYVNNKEGCYHCKKCDARGSWKNLLDSLGEEYIQLGDNAPKTNKVEYRAKLKAKEKTLDKSLADKYHEQLSPEIVKYLKSNKRGLTDTSIKKFKIGWDGKNITIPVFNQKGKLINIRFRRAPNKKNGPKYWNTSNFGKAALFNSETLKQAKDFVVICEGEFDTIIAEQHGFPAVSSTAGAETFKKEWVKKFKEVKNVFICYDNDKAGRKGAKKLAKLFKKKAIIVKLPKPKKAKKVDLTDYFTSLGKTSSDFAQLLDKAKSQKYDFKLIEEDSEFLLHPAISFDGERIYYTLLLPISQGGQVTNERVIIRSGKEKGLVTDNEALIKNQTLKIKQLTEVPDENPRWATKDIKKYLNKKEKIQPGKVFFDLRELLLKYIDFQQEGDAEIITLWLMGTYCFPIFDAFPYLYFIGVKRTGKTKTLLLIERLAFNAILSSNISPAVLFRLVEAKRCTLALDESERLAYKSQQQEILELLNSGYKQGAKAHRISKNKNGNFTIDTFQVYSPKAIANISGLNEVLEDRSITITMIRTDNAEKGNLAVTKRSENWPELRSLLYSFSLDYAKEISQIYHHDPKVCALLNRQNELWRPLLSIAKLISQDDKQLFLRIEDLAIKKAKETSAVDLEDFDSAVLLALRDLIGSDDQKLKNKEIKNVAHDYLEEDQKEHLTSRGVGAALKRFGIQGKKVRGYYRYQISSDTVNDLLKRYGLTVVE